MFRNLFTVSKIGFITVLENGLHIVVVLLLRSEDEDVRRGRQ